MATQMQKRALDKMVEKGRKGKKVSVSAVMREVGFSNATATHPDKLTKSKGFIELCDELGLTDGFLTRALVADIKKKPGKRTKELELGFKVRGRLKDNGTPPGTVNNFLIIGGDQLKRIASRVLDGDTASEAAPGGLPDSNQP